MKKIKKLRRRNVIILSVVLTLIVLGVLVNSNKKYEVEVDVIDSGKVVKLIEEIAEVRSNSQLILHSEVAGIVDEVLVSEGDSVSLSEHILTIDDGTLEFDIKSAELMIESLDAQFKEAIKPADKNRLSIAENNVRSVKASMDQAKEIYDNNVKLFEGGSISQSDLDNSLVSYEILKSNYENAISQVSIIKKGASSNISDKFKLEIENLNTGLGKMKDIRKNYIINSPANAVVTEKFVSSGDFLIAGSRLFELTDLNDLYLNAEVLDSDAVNIRKGTGVNIIFEDLNYKGLVEKVYPKAYNKVSDLGIVQKRIKIDIKILSDDTILRLGQEVDVQFIEEEIEDDIRIFKDYVYDSNNKKYVLILDKGTIIEREIELGLEGEDYYQVVNGISLGEKVITNFGDELVVGSKATEK